MIPSQLYTELSRLNCLREDIAESRKALAGLPVSPKPDFVEFFERFHGPAGSEGSGFEILDITDDEPSVITASQYLREEFGLPPHYLVISNLLAGGLLIYDCSSDAVYDVDFEGGFELMVQSRLQPRWTSFDEFLSEYFVI